MNAVLAGPVGVKRVILVVRRSRPVLLNEQTFSRSVGMSQKCYFGSGTGIIQSLRRRAPSCPGFD